MKQIISLLFCLVIGSMIAATPEPQITSLLLVNGTNGQTQPLDGATLPEGSLCHVRAVVNTQTTKSVIFTFTPSGDRQIGNVSGGIAKSSGGTAVAGQYTVTAVPYSAVGGTGTGGPQQRGVYTITGAATPTPTPSASPTPTTTPTPTPTPTPSVTPTPTPPTAQYVTVTVIWNATKDDRYTILYGRNQTMDVQADGGVAVQDGTMVLSLSNLEANTLYYFSDIVTRGGIASPPLPPITYTTTMARNQLLSLP